MPDAGDKTAIKSSYTHNKISYTGKTPLYWISNILPVPVK